MENHILLCFPKGSFLETANADQLHFFLILFHSTFVLYPHQFCLLCEDSQGLYLCIYAVCVNIYKPSYSTPFCSISGQDLTRARAVWSWCCHPWKPHSARGMETYWFKQNFCFTRREGERLLNLNSRSRQGPCGVAKCHTTQWTEPEPGLLSQVGARSF